MKKQLLLSLPADPLPFDPKDESLTKEMVNNWRTYYLDKVRYAYTAEIKTVSKEKILILDVFDIATGQHLYRWFYDKNENYFMWNYKENRCSSATFKYIADYNLHGTFVTTEQASSTVRQFFKITEENDALTALWKWHDQDKERKLKKQHDRIKQQVDEKMKEARDIPKGIYKWIDNHLLDYSRYLFYQYSRKKYMDGYCSHCKTNVKVTGPKHRASGICPNCKSPVTFIAKGKYTSILDRNTFGYLQPTKSGFMLRMFSVRRSYDKYYGFEDFLHEYERVFYNDDGDGFFTPEYKSYKWDNFKQTGKYRFCEASEWQGGNSARLYPDNLNKLLKHRHPKAKYINYNQIARECGILKIRQFIEWPPAIKCIEQMMKTGLYNLASDTINEHLKIEDPNANLIQVLDITRDELKEIRKLNINSRELEIYKSINRKIGTVDKQHLDWINNHFYSPSNFLFSLNYCTPHKAIKYILSQRDNYKTGSWYTRSEAEWIQDAARDWRDYIRDAKILNMDIKNKSVLFPKNLKQQHQHLIEMVNAIKKEKTVQRVQEITDHLNNLYYFESGQYLIRAPKSHEEIIKEGEKLHHCVGRYAEDHAFGETVILFIRRHENPELPYCTLELDPEDLKVRQYHGYGNDVKTPLDPSVKKFIQTWERKILKKLTQKQRQSA